MTVSPDLSCISFISPRISSRPAGSSPAVGSSRIMTSGRIAMTPAIAARRFCPPESSNGEASKESSGKWTFFRASYARSAASLSSSPWFFGPNFTSSRTVVSKSWCSGYWNTIPTLVRNFCLSKSLSDMSFPLKYICPSVGAISPLNVWIIVDLPLPVCPMMPIKSPLFT